MAEDKLKAVYTCQELATLCNVDRSTIWRWCRKGIIGYEKINGRIRIPSSKIRRMLPATFESIRDMEGT